MKKILFLFLYLLFNPSFCQTKLNDCNQFLKSVPFFFELNNKQNITNELLNEEYKNLVNCGKLDSTDSEILNPAFLFKNFYKNDKLIKPNITNQEILNKFFVYKKTEDYKNEYNKIKFTNYINKKIILKQNRKEDSLVLLKIGERPEDIHFRLNYNDITNSYGMNYLEAEDELKRFMDDYVTSTFDPFSYEYPKYQNLSEIQKQSMILSKNILFFIYAPDILKKDSVNSFFENEIFKTSLKENYIYYSISSSIFDYIDDLEFQKFNISKNELLSNLNKTRGFYFLKYDKTFTKLNEYNMNFNFIEFKIFLDN